MGQRTGWRGQVFFFSNKAALFQGHSHYLSALCLPPLSAVHMPLLIPHTPRGRLRDYPCVSWERQDAGRHILSGWVVVDDCNKLFRTAPSFLWVCTICAGVVAVGRWPCWPAGLLLDFSAYKTTLKPCLLWPTYCRLGVALLMLQKAGWEGMTMISPTWWGKKTTEVSTKLWKNVFKSLQIHQPPSSFKMNVLNVWFYLVSLINKGL